MKSIVNVFLLIVLAAGLVSCSQPNPAAESADLETLAPKEPNVIGKEVTYASGDVSLEGCIACDAVNDSPSLVLADVSMSIGNSNALAVDSAKVVNAGSKLGLLQQLFKISDKVVLTIRQNLFWAFANNLMAIPLAAAGYLDPTFSTLSMAFSDAIVIINSLRLEMILPNSIR